MKFNDLGQYLFVPALSDHPARYLHEMKRLEGIFIAIRWLWVVIIFIMAWLHHPESATVMVALGGGLGLCNAAAFTLNRLVEKPGAQRRLSLAMLAVDALIAWGIILLFARDFYTAAYAGFGYVIIEAAIRFGMTGSMSMLLVFIAGLYGTFLYRDAAFGVRFSTSGFAFWVALMAMIAVSVGATVYEGRRQRRRSEQYLRDNILLEERQRIARELHDTVLKTLHGLTLEAHVLESRGRDAPPFVGETARYIEEVCARTGREIREVIFDLRGEHAPEGIAERIAGLLDGWSEESGIAAGFSLSGEDTVVPPEAARHVVNVVSEVLINIRRHAGASRVDMAVAISGGELSVTVRDNGRGIGGGMDEPADFVAGGKLGIAGMKERVELLGGRLLIESDGNGTRVAFIVPLAPLPAEDV